MEGTCLPFKAIAAEFGIGTTTLFRWWKRRW
jgi:transposase-like protein